MNDQDDWKGKTAHLVTQGKKVVKNTCIVEKKIPTKFGNKRLGFCFRLCYELIN